MKLLRIAPLALITAALGCSQKSDDDTATGGSSGLGAAGSAGQAAGATSGAGGSAGVATTGGAGGTGGSSGTTSMAGTGGSAAGAGAGGNGGSGAGTGGAAGTAGAGTAGAGMAGMAGMAGGDGTLDPNVIVPGLDGLYWELRTMNETAPTDPRKYWLTDMSGDVCATGADWASAGLTRMKSWTAKGTPGQKYTINFEIRGLMALRCYDGGTPTDMMPNATAMNNTFYAGGMPFMDSPINTYQLAITPAVTGETTSTYFLNGLPSSSGKCDEAITYMVSIKNKFVIMGDSTITLSNHLSDCQALQNCGPSATDECMPRTVDVTGVEVHASPYQPVADIFNDTTFYPQWMVFDVQSITSP